MGNARELMRDGFRNQVHTCWACGLHTHSITQSTREHLHGITLDPLIWHVNYFPHDISMK